MRTKNLAACLLAALLCFAGGALAQWRHMPGAANDVGVGPTGEAWVIGTDRPYPNDHGIYRWDGNNWQRVDGGAVRIDVGPNGPWVVNSSGGIFRWTGNGWQQMPGAAKDVGIGANGTVWVIGTNAETGGFGIYRWNPGINNWDKIPGSAVRIDVDPNGNAWVVTSGNAIFRYNGSAFVQTPGAAKDVGIGANGSVFVVGTDNGLYEWTGSNWNRRDGVLENVSADHRGNPWAVNAGKMIYAWAHPGGGGAAPAPPVQPAGPSATTVAVQEEMKKRYNEALAKLMTKTRGDALSRDQAQAVFNWIAERVSSSRQSYCYKDSYGRGVGTIPGCPAGQQLNGALCYPECRSGWGGAGPVCWQNCPAGFRDDGAFCAKPGPYGRGAGYPWKFGDSLNDSGMFRRCESDHGRGNCEKNGLIVYPKCRAGYHNVGCCICSPNCPGGFTDIGVSCTKPTYGRGAGYPLSDCGAKQMDAGLCYDRCRAGFDGVGPVCWAGCPSGKVNCGAGCASSTTTCVSSTASMVTAPIMLAVNIASLGGTGAVSTGTWGTIKAAVTSAAEATKTAREVASAAMAAGNAAYQAGSTTYMWVNDYVGNFRQLTNEGVVSEIDRRFSADGARWVKEQYAMVHLNLMAGDDIIRTDLAMLSAASGFDPTGVTGVISAYAHPKCAADKPFPNVTARY